MQYKLVRLDGSIVQVRIDAEEPAVNSKILSLRVGASVVTCKYLGNYTLAEQEDFNRLKPPMSETLALIGFASVIGLLVWGVSASVNANTNIRPSTAVASAAAPLMATQDISISNSEYSIMSACDARDAQLYRVYNKAGNQIAVICGGSAIRLPWIPQKGFTLRYTN